MSDLRHGEIRFIDEKVTDDYPDTETFLCCARWNAQKAGRDGTPGVWESCGPADTCDVAELVQQTRDAFAREALAKLRSLVATNGPPEDQDAGQLRWELIEMSRYLKSLTPGGGEE